MEACLAGDMQQHLAARLGTPPPIAGTSGHQLDPRQSRPRRGRHSRTDVVAGTAKERGRRALSPAMKPGASSPRMGRWNPSSRLVTDGFLERQRWGSMPDVGKVQRTLGALSRSSLLLEASFWQSASGPPPAAQTGPRLRLATSGAATSSSSKRGSGRRLVSRPARARAACASPPTTSIIVGCGSDDTIAALRRGDPEAVKRFRDIGDPETFDLPPNGRDLYISNEDDSEAT